MGIRPVTPAEAAELDAMVAAFRPQLAELPNGQVTAMCFAALMTIATRDGPGAAAAWARAQADRLDLLDCAGTA